MATVLPTTKNRIGALDLLRGIAILGILPANMAAFAEPSGPLFNTALPIEPLTASDHLVNAIVLSFVAGKFRSLLALLFGIGIWMQFEKRRGVKGAWPGGYLKRTAYLALFGLAHGFLIWYGDILWIYSGTAFVACLLAGAPDKALKWIVGIGGAFSLFVASAALAGGFWMHTQGWTTMPAKWGGGMAFEPAGEVVLFTQRSYLSQVLFRLELFGLSSLPGILFFLPFLLPLFGLGILLARSGVLKAPSQHPRVRNWVLAIGLGLGLPLNALGLLTQDGPHLYIFTLGWELFLGPLLACGYLMLGAMWAEAGWLNGIQQALRNVGRIAFSAYILQSLVCTFIFYSFGLGLFGSLDRVQQMSIVPAVWMVDILFAGIWLHFYDLGPLEWAWRSLTEGKRLPIRKGAIAALKPAEPAFDL